MLMKIDAQVELERLLVAQERSVQEAFATFLQDTHSDLELTYLRNLLEQGRVETALRIVDSHVLPLGNALVDTFQTVGAEEAAALATSLGAEASRMAVVFDPTDPFASALMRTNRLQFIQGFTAAQREATRLALAESFQIGEGPLAAARSFRNSIGLTPTQWGAVNNYRRALERNSAEALGRALRDRRFDRSVLAAIANGEPLTPERIARMTQRYRERMLMLRAETIARTETIKIANQARYEALQQVIKQAGINPALVERTWRSSRDKRVRDTHKPRIGLDGQTVGLNELFTSPSGAKLLFPGDPSAPPEEIINCRCSVTVRIKKAKEVKRAA